MTTRHHRRSPRVRFGRSVAAVALAFAGLVLAAAFVGLTVQGNAIGREIAGYHNDLAADQAQYDALAAQIANQNTPDYVKQKARDYGYIAPNESIIAVQRDGQANDALARTLSEGPSRIARWFSFFFGSR
ncbi:MAG TPA: septum formation initiator family protein [Candidatus Udaeobacter sp.]|nr:septum formation initiator family protein [Candidatus Udaeobacter sp.]